jgi:aldose 1-epimerase
MRYYVAEESQVVAGREYGVIVLTAGESRAEFWPALGCNCLRWQVGGHDLVYAPDPAEILERPSRGGIPVLFPFPNRIRDGRFFWSGRVYQLPRNDSAQQNAIHGFAPRNPWRVVGHGTHNRGGPSQPQGAWLRAEFQIARDASDSSDLWPADARLTLTVSLTQHALRYAAVVENLDTTPLPFGLGYHPYFATTPLCRIQTPARARWELRDNLPTGLRLPLSGANDLQQPRPVAGLTLDDVYTDFPDTALDADGFVERGRVEYPEWGGALHVRTSPAFRELVLFTPPHRQAVCLEPYTCPTDAIHLQEHEDVGWRVLARGGQWRGEVEYCWEGA